MLDKKKLAAAMKERGWGMVDLAYHSKLSYETIKAIKNSQQTGKNITSDTVIAICRALNKSFDEICINPLEVNL
jgi:DNA-binding Xre family transcriptional regulator